MAFIKEILQTETNYDKACNLNTFQINEAFKVISYNVWKMWVVKHNCVTEV